jgi:hypothetical protein
MTMLPISMLETTIRPTFMDQISHYIGRMTSNYPPQHTLAATYLLMLLLHGVAEQEQVPNFPILDWRLVTCVEPLNYITSLLSVAARTSPFSKRW